MKRSSFMQTCLKKHGNFVWLTMLAFLFLPFVLYGCIPVSSEKKTILTPEEHQWLADHENELTVVTSNWPPYEYFDDEGNYKGYVADYVGLLQKKLNVRFRIIRTKTWAEAEGIALGYKAAMITSIKFSPERAEYLNFAGPFREVPISIIARDSEKETLSLEKMDGRTVATVAGYFTGDAIRKSYPKILVLPVEDELAGVRLLSLGGVDAYIGDVGVVVFNAEREGIRNLRVAGSTDFKYVLNIGSRKDWPIVSTILQKGMNDISLEENDRLYQKWVHVESKTMWETLEFWLIIAGITCLALLSITVVMIWNRTLQSKVDR